MSDLKRRSSKAPKPKAIISLFAKELIVLDEKSKVHLFLMFVDTVFRRGN